jgi:hypothetical protein
MCSVCDGKGSFWIGPQSPSEIHQHTHAHEAGEATHWQLEQLMGNLTGIVEKLDETADREWLTLERIARVTEEVEMVASNYRSERSATDSEVKPRNPEAA